MCTPSDSTPPIALPWLSWQINSRVVVRRREPDGLYDTVGILVQRDASHVKIRTSDAVVSIPAQKMVTGKVVSLPPSAAQT